MIFQTSSFCTHFWLYRVLVPARFRSIRTTSLLRYAVDSRFSSARILPDWNLTWFDESGGTFEVCKRLLDASNVASFLPLLSFLLHSKRRDPCAGSRFAGSCFPALWLFSFFPPSKERKKGRHIGRQFQWCWWEKWQTWGTHIIMLTTFQKRRWPRSLNILQTFLVCSDERGSERCRSRTK